MPSTTRKKVRTSRSWVRWRKATQLLALLAFLALFVGVAHGLPVATFSAIMRLDPLLALAHLLSARALLAGSALSLVTLVLTVLFGRVWCGWLCPLGTLLDVLPLRGLRSGTLDGAEFLRRIKYVLLAATVGAALLASLSLLVLDPLTILTRALAAGLWPALGGLVTALEQALYRVEPLRGWVSAFDPLLRPWLISSLPLEYEGSLPTVFLLLAIMMLGILAERFWCRYVCPLGGLLGLVSKLAVVRRLVDPACKGCLVCSRVCPTGTIRPSQGYASDPGECTVCMECIDACPRSMNRFGMAQSRIAGWNAYDPTRRQALASIGAGFLSVGLLRLTSKDAGPLLRPPGASERRLLETCVRCGACIRVCPTGALHPSLGEGGPEGLWTPRLLPRQGYCDYGCTACGSVCPVQAIPPLRLVEKRERIIGTAAVDRDRCFPWSSDRECIVCEEMCPLPGKAIRLEEVPVSRDGVGPSTIQRPIVLEEECIGCGICENKCPVEGEAAIRVKPIEGIEA